LSLPSELFENQNVLGKSIIGKRDPQSNNQPNIYNGKFLLLEMNRGNRTYNTQLESLAFSYHSQI
jgi:hypothetical protein